jgi:hypothetical protein
MLARIGLAAATFAALAVLPALVPTSAAASTVSYQLTLTESAPTMTFGGATPSFRAYLTPPADDPPLKFGAFYLTVDSIDSTRYEGSISGTSPYMLYETGINPPVVGQHTVVANYQSPNHGLLTSAPVTLTVLKTTAPIGCVNYKVENTYVPNTPLTIEVVPGYTNAPAEVKNGTFTLTFSGARTFTTANLTANSAGQISASLPPAYGIYPSQMWLQRQCLIQPNGSAHECANRHREREERSWWHRRVHESDPGHPRTDDHLGGGGLREVRFADSHRIRRSHD